MTLAASGVKTETNQTRLTNVEMALEALRNVIRNNPGILYTRYLRFLNYVFCCSYTYFTYFFLLGVEMQCIGHFKLLFSLLRLDNCTKVQALAIDVNISLYFSMNKKLRVYL